MNELEDRIPELRERTDLGDEVERRAGPAVRVSGGTATFHCPNRDHPDRTPSFTVKDGRWRCWSACDRGGDVIDLLVWLDGVTKAEAIERLAEQAGMSRAPGPRPALTLGILDRFLAGRGWDRETADRLGLHVVSVAGRARVRFPFRRGGKVVHYQDRAVGSGEPKWLNPPGPIPCPFNADSMARAPVTGAAYLLEGVSDVVGLLHAFPEAVAVGAPGSGVFKTAWAQAFAGLVVIVIADNDKAGEKFRGHVHDVLTPVAARVCHLWVPDPHNDLDAWRQADPDAFPFQMLDQADMINALLGVSA